MRKILTTRKRVVVAGVAAVAVLGTGGAAFAYFTSTGSGSGNASVGSASNWSVSQGVTTGGPLLPGSGTETVTFTVTNTSSGKQQLSDSELSAVLKLSGNNVYSAAYPVGSPSPTATVSAGPVSGCDGNPTDNWFTLAAPAITGGPTVDLVHSGTATVTVTISMNDAAANQDACENIAGPEVDLSISDS